MRRCRGHAHASRPGRMTYHPNCAYCTAASAAANQGAAGAGGPTYLRQDYGQTRREDLALQAALKVSAKEHHHRRRREERHNLLLAEQIAIHESLMAQAQQHGGTGSPQSPGYPQYYGAAGQQQWYPPPGSYPGYMYPGYYPGYPQPQQGWGQYPAGYPGYPPQQQPGAAGAASSSSSTGSPATPATPEKTKTPKSSSGAFEGPGVSCESSPKIEVPDPDLATPGGVKIIFNESEDQRMLRLSLEQERRKAKDLEDRVKWLNEALKRKEREDEQTQKSNKAGGDRSGSSNTKKESVAAPDPVLFTSSTGSTIEVPSENLNAAD